MAADYFMRMLACWNASKQARLKACQEKAALKKENAALKKEMAALKQKNALLDAHVAMQAGEMKNVMMKVANLLALGQDGAGAASALPQTPEEAAQLVEKFMVNVQTWKQTYEYLS